MGEDRFNALLLLYVHKDIEIDISKVVEMYARQYPRRMLLFNPLSMHQRRNEKFHPNGQNTDHLSMGRAFLE
jgi:hypothetical protein